jgi:hypothetical protein
MSDRHEPGTPIGNRLVLEQVIETVDTIYNSKRFFVKNPIGRYAIGDREKLKFNDDGSLTIYVQNESPGKDKEPNWPPAPKDTFSLFMRLSWPNKEILDGIWKPPHR